MLVLEIMEGGDLHRALTLGGMFMVKGLKFTMRIRIAGIRGGRQPSHCAVMQSRG